MYVARKETEYPRAPLHRRVSYNLQSRMDSSDFFFICLLVFEMSKFHLHIDLPAEYAPISKRGVKGSTLSTFEIMAHRMNNKKNCDLWADGSLYPIDPRSMQYPQFQSITQLIMFLCEGQNGLLGYCERLRSYGTANLLQKIQSSECMLNGLLADYKEKETIVSQTKEDNARLRDVILKLNESNAEVQQDLQKLRRSHDQLKEEVQILNRKLNNNKRKRVVLKDIDELSRNGGYRKKKIQAFK